MTHFYTYIKEEKEKIKVVTLTEFKMGEEDGWSSTVKRIDEECKNRKIDHKVIFVRSSYYIEKGLNKDNIYLGHIDPKTNKKEVIEIDPLHTVVIVRKAVSETEKGLSLISTLESKNVFVINNRKSMEICNNKLSTTTITEKAGVRNPKTVILSECDRNLLFEIMQKFNKNTYPIVAKTILGEHGVGVMIIESFESLYSVLQTVWSKKIQVVIQEYVKSQYDIRAIIIDGELIAAMKRYKPKGEFRTNAAQGGEVKPHEMTKEQERAALVAADAVYGYWIGCDMIVGEDEKLYLLEVNTSAGTEGVEKASGINVVGHLIDHVLNKDNWRRNNIEVGYREYMKLYDEANDKWIKMVCKLDTGNGITSSVHADDIKINGDTVTFKLNGTKMKKKIEKRYKVHLGKQEKFTESRVSVFFDIKIGNRMLEDIEFQLTSRKGTIKELEPILIGRRLINKFGFVINSDNEFMVSK